MFARAGQARRGLRAAERACIGRRGRARRRVRPRRGCSSPARRTPDAGRRTRRGARGSRSLARRSRRGADVAASDRRARRARSARHLLHEREHRAAEGRRALAPRELAAHVSRRDHDDRAAAAPCACSRCSTWRAGRSRSAPGRRAGRCTSCGSPTPRRCCATDGPPSRRAAVLHPRGVGAHARARQCADTTSSTLVEADTGTSATPPELLHAIKDALPRTVDARVLRLDRGRTRRAARRRRPVAQARQRRRRRSRASTCGSTETGEVCLRSPFLMDGYFDDPDATAEALRRRLVPHRRSRRARRRRLPVDRRPRARRHPHRRRDGRADRGRSRCSAEHPAIAEVAVVGVPDAQWGEVVTAVVVVPRRRASRARRRRAAGVLRGPPRAVQAARAGSRSSTRSPAPPRPARSSAP